MSKVEEVEKGEGRWGRWREVKGSGEGERRWKRGGVLVPVESVDISCVDLH